MRGRPRPRCPWRGPSRGGAAAPGTASASAPQPTRTGPAEDEPGGARAAWRPRAAPGRAAAAPGGVGPAAAAGALHDGVGDVQRRRVADRVGGREGHDVLAHGARVERLAHAPASPSSPPRRSPRPCRRIRPSPPCPRERRALRGDGRGDDRRRGVDLHGELGRADVPLGVGARRAERLLAVAGGRRRLRAALGIDPRAADVGPVPLDGDGAVAPAVERPARTWPAGRPPARRRR